MIKRILSFLIIGSAVCIIFAACNKPKDGDTAQGNAPGPAANPPEGGTGPAPAANGKPAFKVAWVAAQVPPTMKVGQASTVTVTVQNAGDEAWPAPTAKAQGVSFSYHWLNEKGDKPILFDGVRTSIPKNIPPGKSSPATKVKVVAPPTPGKYKLQLTLVHDGVAWFETTGAKTKTVAVTVQ